ncbi:ANK [Seminavis robusta]|uniref:ANK n=1 Tax=Seminavis robusta TaxID=568900 RepID=A0A9N8DCF0_9STRA|nr:ANK [Seminavis robusta]|eukprot:Sro56_g032710.1 ANK (313) ;mRNA; f:47813-48751
MSLASLTTAANTLKLLSQDATTDLTSSSSSSSSSSVRDKLYPTEAPSKGTDSPSCGPKELASASSEAVLVEQEEEEELSANPIEYLEQLFAKYGINLKNRRRKRPVMSLPADNDNDMFEQVDAYDMETARAVRAGDLDTLRQLYHDKGYSLSACNRFGESLLHMSCRRGHASMVRFMLVEAKVNPRVMDDFGRTAFHDVCWSSQPNLETMDVLLQVLPPIGLLMQDARGNSPLEYAPRKHWPVWLEYLQEREHIFVNWIREKRERVALTRQHKQQEIEKLRRAANHIKGIASPPLQSPAPPAHRVEMNSLAA